MQFRFTLNGLEIIVVKGDITDIEADAIVNAANPYLKHGGGVAGAIVRKGGDIIQRESDEYVRIHGPIPVGGAAVTGAGRLKAKYIIHAVGPVYGEKGGDEKLASAIKSALSKAEELKLNTIALPAISTGVYGYPLEKCAEIMANILKKFSKTALSLSKIIVCLYDEKAFNIFSKVFNKALKADNPAFTMM